DLTHLPACPQGRGIPRTHLEKSDGHLASGKRPEFIRPARHQRVPALANQSLRFQRGGQPWPDFLVELDAQRLAELAIMRLERPDRSAETRIQSVDRQRVVEAHQLAAPSRDGAKGTDHL